MNQEQNSHDLPLTQALAWIVASVFLITGPVYAGFKYYIREKKLEAYSSQNLIQSIIQTGPQKEALKTEALAEILGLSIDVPTSSYFFDIQKAEETLRRFPLIVQARVELANPTTLYIDYTTRQPLAWLEDFVNVVLDKEGYPFPFAPFFSPKHLPSIYLGLSFSELSENGSFRWGQPLVGKEIELGLSLLEIVTDPKTRDLLNVQRIDVSKAYAESDGIREVILNVEDRLVREVGSGKVHYSCPRILRLSTAHYRQELGNYLQLRPQLLKEDEKEIACLDERDRSFKLKEKVIDFRISKLAFIE